ncbi:hypothetical protein A3Q56_01622 [Intoshia linei]|uniref:Transcription initiation factor TFIID subunit 9B n=1 Tax=Intoshia linei TaxID=1819745 RepID=A0A177B8L0_9BILA|nr:hypothetical protein A3Q56_01622 [Intoshia linei]
MDKKNLTLGRKNIDTSSIQDLLAKYDIKNYDDGVIPAVVEFAYSNYFVFLFLLFFGYTSRIVNEADEYASFRGDNMINENDLKFSIDNYAVQHGNFKVKKMYNIAAQKNLIPLPTIQPFKGIKIPDDKNSLTNPTYTLKLKDTHQFTKPNLLSNFQFKRSDVAKCNSNVPISNVKTLNINRNN